MPTARTKTAIDPTDLVLQEREVADLLRSVPSELIAARLRRARERLGLAIRDLATAANVNKNSIVRLEKGLAPQPLTVLKICSAMGLHVANLAKPAAGEDEVLIVHRRQDDRWFDPANVGAGPVVEKPLSPEERAKLAAEGLTTPMLMFRNRLETGQLLTNLMELYGPSEVRTHMGEEMAYVLEGEAILTVGSEKITLGKDESATFWSSEEHSYAPAPGSPLPVRVLTVTIQRSRT